MSGPLPIPPPDLNTKICIIFLFTKFIIWVGDEITTTQVGDEITTTQVGVHLLPHEEHRLGGSRYNPEPIT